MAQLNDKKYISQLEFTSDLLRKDAKTLGLTAIERAVLTTMSANAPISSTSVSTLASRTGFGTTTVKKALKSLKDRCFIVLVTDSMRNVACKYAFNLVALGYPKHVHLQRSDHIDMSERIKLQKNSKRSSADRKNDNLNLALADMGLSGIKVTSSTKTEREVRGDVLPELG